MSYRKKTRQKEPTHIKIKSAKTGYRQLNKVDNFREISSLLKQTVTWYRENMVMKIVREYSQEMKFELNLEWWEDIASANTFEKKSQEKGTSVPKGPGGSRSIWGTKRMPVSKSGKHDVRSRGRNHYRYLITFG